MTMSSLRTENLFFPGLITGVGDLREDEAEQLRVFFRDVCDARGFPLHPVVCWNAIYREFNLESGRYENAPVEDLASVANGDEIDALPIGAFVSVPAGRSRDEFWGEVVYKEGRRPEFDILWDDPQLAQVPGTLSGAPIFDRSDSSNSIHQMSREAMVIDFEAVEPPNVQNLERQRRSGGAVDERHHVIVNARYEPADADVDDITFFARWMIAHQRLDLTQGGFGACLTREALENDELLFSALIGSLATIRELIETIPDCLMWRDFVFAEPAYRERVENHEIPLGGEDLKHLARSFARVPRGRNVEYSPLGPRIVGMLGVDADLNGPGWLTAICHTSRFLVDWIAEESSDGVIDTPAGFVHLRIDDAGQVGGIWRAQLLASGWDPVCAIPPDIPLGLGAATSTETVATITELEEELSSDLIPIEVQGTDIGFRVTLARRDIELGRLRISRELADELSEALTAHGSTAVVIRVAVEGSELPLTERVQHGSLDDGVGVTSLHSLEWSWPFVVGSKITVVWPRGAAVLDVNLARALEPCMVNGISYEFECDTAMFARFAGVELPPSTPPGRTLRDLVLAAFRNRGEMLTDGSRRSDLRKIVLAVYGPGASSAAERSIEIVLSSLLADGTIVAEDDELIWTPVIGRRTHALDRTLLDEYGASAVRRLVQEYEVGLHFRRLWVSEEASEARKAAYRKAWREAGSPTLFPSELPMGMTFVVPHVRGSGGHHNDVGRQGSDGMTKGTRND
jgi:hypothetical protein